VERELPLRVFGEMINDLPDLHYTW
jgi:hypothetical protein